jgi:hypothetical protein
LLIGVVLTWEPDPNRQRLCERTGLALGRFRQNEQ